MEAILRNLYKHPDGISVNELYRTLKDSKGKTLMARKTFFKKLNILKAMGLVVEEYEGKGRNKILKLKDSSKIITEMISRIKIYKELFKKYLDINLSNLDKKNNSENLRILQKINLSKLIIFIELDRMRDEILSSELSDRLKRELILKTFEVEKEINQAFFDMILEYKNKIEAVELFYEIYRLSQEYAMDLKHYSEKGKSFVDVIMSLASEKGFGKEIKEAYKLLTELVNLDLKDEDLALLQSKFLPEIKDLLEELKKFNPLSIRVEVESELNELKEELESDKK